MNLYHRDRMRNPLILLAAASLLAACERGDESAGRAAPATSADTAIRAAPAAPAPLVMVDTALPPATAGEPGWDYHKLATADLNGDGQPERASLIARVGLTEDDGFLWDDGQPWQLYIIAPDGTRTDVFRRWVQMGTMDAHVSTDVSGTGRTLLLVENTPYAVRIIEVIYAGPGKVTAVERFTREIHPDSGFAVQHFSPSRRAAAPSPRSP
jgi:hypothetical protein